MMQKSGAIDINIKMAQPAHEQSIYTILKKLRTNNPDISFS